MAKILLVEDDTNLSEIYQARMEAEGYEVVSASDGETALAVAAKEKPDLIISDVMMPKISGFEMLDILRNTEDLKNTPVIMLTALGQTDDKGRAERLGADRYLVKSQVTLEDIVNAAHSILEGDTNAGAATGSVSGIDVVSPAPAAAPTETDPATTAAADTSTPAAQATVAEPPATPAEPAVVSMPLATPPADDSTAAAAQPATPPADDTTTAVQAADDVPVVPVATPPADDTTASATPAPRQVDGYEHRQVAPVRVTNAAPVATRPVEQPPQTADDSPAPAVEQQPTTPPADVNLDEGVVDHAINQLLNKAPQQPLTDSGHGQILPSADGQAATGQDDKPLKKVISPIEKPPAASLDELLAREEARDGVADATSRDFANQATDPALQPPAAPAEPSPEAAIPTEQATTQPAPADDSNQTPPTNKPPIDPNSIAL